MPRKMEKVGVTANPLLGKFVGVKLYHWLGPEKAGDKGKYKEELCFFPVRLFSSTSAIIRGYRADGSPFIVSRSVSYWDDLRNYIRSKKK